MEKLQVGFVGLRRGGGLVRALAAHPRVEVAALCDLNEETLVTMGKDFSLPENRLYTAFEHFVNAPLDVIVIATPIEFHAQQSIAAMESGKHVLCEQTVGLYAGRVRGSHRRPRAHRQRLHDGGELLLLPLYARMARTHRKRHTRHTILRGSGVCP